MSHVALTTIIECQECGARGLGPKFFHDECAAIRAWHRWFEDHPDRPGDENPVRVPLEEIPVVSVAGLAEQVKAELHSDEDGTTRLAGKLGDAISEEAGSCSLEFITPEQLA